MPSITFLVGALSGGSTHINWIHFQYKKEKWFNLDVVLKSLMGYIRLEKFFSHCNFLIGLGGNYHVSICLNCVWLYLLICSPELCYSLAVSSH